MPALYLITDLAVNAPRNARSPAVTTVTEILSFDGFNNLRRLQSAFFSNYSKE